MNYFLRLTETPEEDMERGCSFHLFGGNLTGDEIEDVELFENNYYQKLEGLCGFDVTDMDKEYIEDKINCHSWCYGEKAYIFIGRYIDDCGDGDVFEPIEFMSLEEYYKQS